MKTLTDSGYTLQAAVKADKARKKLYLKSGELGRLCARAGISTYTRKLLFGPGSSARIYFEGRAYPLYIREVVMKILKIDEPT